MSLENQGNDTLEFFIKSLRKQISFDASSLIELNFCKATLCNYGKGHFIAPAVTVIAETTQAMKAIKTLLTIW